MVVDCASSSAAFERRADKQRAFDGCRNRDWFSSYLGILSG
jgi:hypothetical protein